MAKKKPETPPAEPIAAPPADAVEPPVDAPAEVVPVASEPVAAVSAPVVVDEAPTLVEPPAPTAPAPPSESRAASATIVVTNTSQRIVGDISLSILPGRNVVKRSAFMKLAESRVFQDLGRTGVLTVDEE